MRLFAAIGLFFLSLGLLMVGVAQRTVWAPPTHHVVSIEYDATNPYIVIPNSTLSAYVGEPTVTVSGALKSFIAEGRESDIRAWVGDANHTELVVKTEKGKSTLDAKPSIGMTAYGNPDGSDLWRAQAASNKTGQLTINNTDGAAALIASDGFGSAPNKIQIKWPIPYNLTFSTILIYGGGVMLLAAFIMNILAIRDHRKRRGPRRRTPKPPQGPRLRGRNTSQIIVPKRGRRAARKVVHLVPITLLVSLVAGCSPIQDTATPTPTPSDTILGDPAALLPSQIERIINNVSKVASKADAKKNRDLLAARFSGPALDMRAAHYFLQSKSDKISAPQFIAAKPITFSLPAATSIWPRSFMVVTDQAGTALPQLLVLTQDSPRAQYSVRYVVGLMPGAKIPNVPVEEVGAIPVSSDSVYLKLPPLSIPKSYGDLIDKGIDSEFESVFNVTKDKFYQDISASQKAQIAKLTKGKIKFKHTLGSRDITALSTTSGGALVSIYMKDTYTIQPVKPGSAVSVSGQEALMLGSNGSATGINSVYGNMMLFYVPALSDKDRIRLLGVTSGLLRVSAR